MMKITTGQIGCGILALYALSLLGGDPEGAQRSAQTKETKSLVQDSRHAERDSLRLSAVALQRFRRGCQPVEVLGTGKEAFHPPDTVFVDRETKQPFPAGVEICNSRGWSAVTEEGGTATDVAVATPQDSNDNQIPDIVEAQEIYKNL